MRPLGICSDTNKVPFEENEIGPGSWRTGSSHFSSGICAEMAQRGKAFETVQPSASADSALPFLITKMRPAPFSDT